MQYQARALVMARLPTAGGSMTTPVE